MVEKKFLSLTTITIYALAIIGISIGLGLLVSLVNRNTCVEKRLINSNYLQIQENESVERSVVKEHSSKRKRQTEQNTHVKLSKLEDLVKKHNSPFLRSKLQSKNWYTKLDRCEEFTQSQNGTLWESDRLPKSIIPNDYEIELYTPIFDYEIYEGLTLIKVDLNERTDTFIVHAKLLLILGIGLLDRDLKPISIKCGGPYPFNDYWVFKTERPVERTQGPLIMEYLFAGFLNVFESGLFEIKYNGGTRTNMLASHFEPLDARKAFPCFDEPSFKATFELLIDHPIDTIALSNMPAAFDEPILGDNGTVQTTFIRTPKLPTHLIGLVVFSNVDFVSVSGKTVEGEIPVNVWTRREFVEENSQASDTLKMAIDLFDAAEYFFYDRVPGTPEKIDLFALPEYPDDAVPHWGLPLFKENKLLFNEKTVSQEKKQEIALLIAKQYAEFWFGGLVTFDWWNELWLQEGLGDFFKYKIVDETYPNWRIKEQFITEELIQVLVNDGYPSSHPVIKDIYSLYDIYELFDDVETSKVAAIFRMVEFEIGETNLINALINYLRRFQFSTGEPNFLFNSLGKIRDWDAKEFFDRWFLQSNYPSVSVRMRRVNGQNEVNIIQDRFVNSEESIFGLDLLYPSPYNFTWYIPLKCLFGTSPNDTNADFFRFDIEKRQQVFTLTSNKQYTWLHCDTSFAGYYEMDYSAENWEVLGDVLKVGNARLDAVDRANIIHNLFVNAYTEKEKYRDLVDILSYIHLERDLIPWRTLKKHVNDLVNILEYRSSFYAVAKFFSYEMREIEQEIDLWSPMILDHVDGLLRGTILELACRVQDTDCLRNASSYWPQVVQVLTNDDYTNLNRIAPHARAIVYNYHIQNALSFNDWQLAYTQYNRINDLQEQNRFIQALVYTRVPSLLAKLLNTSPLNFFELVESYSKNPLARELMWLYYRRNFDTLLIDTYGLENPDLGQALIDITRTFDSEFLFLELLRFIVFSPSGAEINARFKALEIVSTTYVWLADKEEEIYNAFSIPRISLGESVDDLIVIKNVSSSFIKSNSKGKEFISSIKKWIHDNDANNILKINFLKH